MKAKRSLGQNFLTSSDVAETLVDAAHVSNKDTVVEIGPGMGMITKILLRRAKHVVAVEKDDVLYKNLEQKFLSEIKNKKLNLVHGDILEFSPEDWKLPVRRSSGTGGEIACPPKLWHRRGNWKLIGSIPYNITSILFRKFLEESTQPETICFIVQREVAERIVARNGKESMLSISVKVYGTPKLVKRIRAGSFFPKPKVDSAILIVENISKNNFDGILVQRDLPQAEKHFFNILRTGFSHPRKKLLGNLKPITSKEKTANIFKTCNISPDIRAEKLTVENWLCIAEALA